MDLLFENNGNFENARIKPKFRVGTSFWPRITNILVLNRKNGPKTTQWTYCLRTMEISKCSDEAEISCEDQFLTKDHEEHGPDGEQWTYCSLWTYCLRTMEISNLGQWAYCSLDNRSVVSQNGSSGTHGTQDVDVSQKWDTCSDLLLLLCLLLLLLLLLLLTLLNLLFENNGNFKSRTIGLLFSGQ